MTNGIAIRRNGLVDQVIAHVAGLLTDGTYRVGDRLPPEARLCEMFGVGRSTVREAMRVLANRKLIEVRHGEGTFVAATAPVKSFEERLGSAALDDVYEARLFLELPLAQLAAERRSTRDISAMRKALDARSRACERRDVAAYTDADFAFHLAVAAASKNRALREIYESFVRVVKPLFATAVDAEYIATEDDRLHSKLCDAIAGGDAQATRRLVRSHLSGSRRKIGQRPSRKSRSSDV